MTLFIITFFSFFSLFVMEKAAADSARVRGLLDPKLDVRKLTYVLNAQKIY